jgi:hypothetical protein
MWTKEAVKELLTTNRWAVIKGVLAIYSRQTRDEQLQQATKYHNEVGFNGADSTILSSFAEQIQRWMDYPDQRKYDFPLSIKQFAVAQKKIVKYAGQLAEIANAKAAETPKELVEV